jgi:hypothetical protein
MLIIIAYYLYFYFNKTKQWTQVLSHEDNDKTLIIIIVHSVRYALLNQSNKRNYAL